MNNKNINKNSNQISRKEAIKKMGKYASLTAIGTFIVLNPLQAQFGSLPNPNEASPFEDVE